MCLYLFYNYKQVIDYDELINWSRQEANFSVFATFIPKLVSVPAQALPYAVIAAAGYLGPKAGNDEIASREAVNQPDTVQICIKLMFVFIPFIVKRNKKKRFSISVPFLFVYLSIYTLSIVCVCVFWKWSFCVCACVRVFFVAYPLSKTYCKSGIDGKYITIPIQRAL